MQLQVVIREKAKLIWEGQAETVSSTNANGNFDVLPEHAHYVGKIEKYLIVRSGLKELKWEIGHGIMRVKDDAVEVYLGY